LLLRIGEALVDQVRDRWEHPDRLVDRRSVPAAVVPGRRWLIIASGDEACR